MRLLGAIAVIGGFLTWTHRHTFCFSTTNLCCTTKLKADFELKIADVNESLEKAMVQLQSKKKMAEKERMKREACETKLRESIETHDAEKDNLILGFHREIDELQISWAEEKTELLNRVQKGCIDVIEQSRTWVGASPRSTTVEFSGPDSPIRTRRPNPDAGQYNTTATTTIGTRTGSTKPSPFESSNAWDIATTHFTLDEIGSSLRETEALVQKVLRGTDHTASHGGTENAADTSAGSAHRGL